MVKVGRLDRLTFLTGFHKAMKMQYSNGGARLNAIDSK